MINATAPLHYSELFDALDEDEVSKLAAMCSEFVAVEDSMMAR